MEAMIARAVQILIALGGAYLITLWFALVVWTFQDIQARSRSVIAQIFSTLVVMIFFLPGLLVYMVLRPRYTLDDAFQRSLEEEYLMQDLEELPLCPGCHQYVEGDWIFCPNCRTELRDNCYSCGQLVDLRWEICPYCGADQVEDEFPPLHAPAADALPDAGERFLPPPERIRISEVSIHERQRELIDSAQPTRPIIPATLRVDLRSGDVASEDISHLAELLNRREYRKLAAPKRVTLSENGDHGLRNTADLSSDQLPVGDSALGESPVADDTSPVSKTSPAS